MFKNMSNVVIRYMTVDKYHSNVGTILHTIRNKRKSYERAIAESLAMEDYITINTDINKT